MHSFRALPTPENEDWVLATTSYGPKFVSVLQQGNVSATQFHPEKSGAAGLDVLRCFLEGSETHQQALPSSNGLFGACVATVPEMMTCQTLCQHEPVASSSELCLPL